MNEYILWVTRVVKWTDRMLEVDVASNANGLEKPNSEALIYAGIKPIRLYSEFISDWAVHFRGRDYRILSSREDAQELAIESYGRRQITMILMECPGST